MQSESVVENLLESIPTGEAIKDPREGDYTDVLITNPELIEQGNGFALRLTYSGLADHDGRSFEYQERYTIPTSASEDFIHRIWLGLCHEAGVLPRENKSRILADSEKDRETVLHAFQQVVGNIVSLRLTQDPKSGYMRSRFIRGKK